jgi:chromosome segregation ATPase
MRAIINMTELLRSKTSQIETLSADNEDITSRLQGILTMRDFLIEKLKSAEVALKSVMIEAAALRRQAGADQEVINYLDLRGQELDCKNVELSARADQLQAAYNMQCSAHSYTENQLRMELTQYKTRCEELDDTYQTQKRTLVKEVKRLRAQLSSVASERARHTQQLAALKQILHVTTEG